jgi:hypothetical protein
MGTEGKFNRSATLSDRAVRLIQRGVKYFIRKYHHLKNLHLNARAL